MGREIRDRFSGAVEVFTRKNASGSGHLSDHSKQKVSAKASPSKDLVGIDCHKICCIYSQLLFVSAFPIWLDLLHGINFDASMSLTIMMHVEFIISALEFIFYSEGYSEFCSIFFQDNDSGRRRTSSARPSSLSKRAVATSSRPTSSLGPSDRSSWLLSGSSRLSTSQRLHSGSEQRSSLSRATTSKGFREDLNQSSEHHSRVTDKRKG